MNDIVVILVLLIFAVTTLIISRRLLKMSSFEFFLGLIGLILGLLVGSLVANPVRSLSGPYSNYLAFSVNVFIAGGIFYLFLVQSKGLINFFHNSLNWKTGLEGLTNNSSGTLVDTSILIDGRIEKLAETKFIYGKLIVPRFVLLELQRIADSNDPQKRMKGRKGFEVLNNLQKQKITPIEILEFDDGIKEDVDQKLIKLAKIKKYRLMTVDYNLAQVATIQKVRVLNLNELALSLKPILLPGEFVEVEITQKGKETGQGVGYLVDGTMVVVENGSELVGKIVNGKVARIFQSVAGQMIFIEPLKTNDKKRTKITKK